MTSKSYSLNFLDFDIEILRDCPDVVQYFSLSNDDNPEIKLDYMNLVFVRLPKFIKPLEECESLQDRLLYSLCHAHEYEEQPERLSGNVFDRLFTVIKISNFSSMEQDEYIRRAMFRADLREQLRYAEDQGVLRTAKNMLAKGFSVADVLKATDLPSEQILALK